MEEDKIIMLSIGLGVFTHFIIYMVIDNIFTTYLKYLGLQILIFFLIGFFYLIVKKIVNILIARGYWDRV